MEDVVFGFVHDFGTVRNGPPSAAGAHGSNGEPLGAMRRRTR